MSLSVSRTPIPTHIYTDGSEDGSVRFENFEFIGDKAKWLDYASERLGRFVGLENKVCTSLSYWVGGWVRMCVCVCVLARLRLRAPRPIRRSQE